jgi:hypothetical protein
MKKKNIFRIVFVIFVALVLLVLADMARRTTAPWNKDKHMEQKKH